MCWDTDSRLVGYVGIPIFKEVMRRANIHQVTLLVLIVVVVLLVSSTQFLMDAKASDNIHGLSFPAPAGTQWEIIAGYNTTTHTSSDPHAIDVVRVDAPTEGTPVLSPWTGEISWFDDSCVVVRDDNYGVLICHFFPIHTLERGQIVSRGQHIGVVAPPFYAENNGIAHLHIAVHATIGSGQIQNTVPFIGQFAISGKELADSLQANAHFGVKFTSQAQIGDGNKNFLFPGWNLVSWPTDAGLEVALQPIRNSVRTVLTFSKETQSFQSYSPLVPETLNDLRDVERLNAVWLYVLDDQGAVWDRPDLFEERAISLSDGFNLVTWTGSEKSVADAISSIENSVVAVYAFDAHKQRYITYLRGIPTSASDLTKLTSGQAIWINVIGDMQWIQD